MRWWTLPILGTVAFSLTIPVPADARARFGPGAVFGALSGAMFGGLRPSLSHPRRSTTKPGGAATGDSAPGKEPARSTDTELPEQALLAGMPVSWDGPVFWPHAADDMLDYAFGPNGIGERFWARGTILLGIFADPPAPRSARAAAVAERSSVAPADTAATASDHCGGAQAAGAPDVVIERIARAVEPTAQQREALAQLRSAMAQASDAINSACRATAPTTPLERLAAMQDRVWAMRDAVLTLRVPLERFYDSLDAQQKGRLNHADPDATTGQAGDGLESASACSFAAGAMADTRGIERILRPTKEQRASLQALQMRVAGLTHLILSSCPSQAPDNPLDRLSAAGDRLTVMLFAVMSMGPPLQSFYDSLSDTQKAALSKALSRSLRPGQRI
jgi:LTXXQ motif family protein